MAKLALITGASSGLGEQLCYALSKRGIGLILTGRDEEKLQKVAAHLPFSTQIICSDLAKPQERIRLVELLHKQSPDLIINNAGFGLYGPALCHPTLDLQEMVEVNIQALMELTVEGAKAMIEAKKTGVILNISSAAAFTPYPTFCVYAATKAFVNSFSQGIHEELKHRGIHVLTVCPGQIDTGFRKKASRDFPQKKDKITMDKEIAVALILKQIDHLKPLSIIDWRYKCLIALAKLLPKRILFPFLKNSLQERHRF
jgi:uncharacterized protein